MSSSGAVIPPQRPPYPPSIAILGGTPTKILDDPITAIFLVLFLIGAASHLAIFQVNMRRGQKFAISAILFGFCMARITTCTMRLVWSTHLTNIQIAIAAQIFVAAGVLLLFIINLIFAQRILRASHPQWAWAKWLSLAFNFYYGSIVVMLILIITCTVQSFYTLSHRTRRIDRDIQLVGATYFAVSAFIPIPLILLPKKPTQVENFGKGGLTSKVTILLFCSFILTLGAAFRAGTAYLPRPRSDPAWYHSKVCFYIFNFSIEAIVVALYAIIRVDQRFIIPDGSHGPGDYSVGSNKDVKQSNSSSLDRILCQEQVFEDAGRDSDGQSQREHGGDLEKGPGELELTPIPEVKAEIEKAKTDSEKGEGNVNADIVSEAKSEVTPGQGVETTLEKEETTVEAQAAAMKSEPEKEKHETLEEKDSVIETEISPASRSKLDEGEENTGEAVGHGAYLCATFFGQVVTCVDAVITDVSMPI